MHNPKTSIAVLTLAVGLAAWTARVCAVEVEAEGRSPGDAANCRELALTDALREAVRKGAGVDLTSSTRVTDFQLDYDRVFASAFGYVRNYSVTRTETGQDGIYRVWVRAEVEKGQPEMRDLLALRQLVHLKQAPRVALEVDELIEGAPAESGFARAWFEQAARELQLNLVDLKRATRQDDRLGRRDAVFGDRQTASVREAKIAQDADFIVQVKVRGNYVGKAPYGILGHVYALALDLRAILPDTGAVVASVALPTQERVGEMQAQDAAARDAVHRLLAGRADLGKDSVAGWRIFRRIFSQWVTELDLGAVSRLEFAQIRDSEHDRLVKALGETEGITAVWPREFDSRGLTAVDVESRHDAMGLKTVVLKALGDQFAFDHGTRHYLQFRRVEGGRMVSGLAQTTVETGQVGKPTAADATEAGGASGHAAGAARPPMAAVARTSAGAASSPVPGTSSGMPVWVWILAGVGGVLVLVGLLAGVFVLGRRSRG